MPTSVFCAQDLPDFVQRECGVELGGLTAFALIQRDQAPTETDLYTLSWWQQKLAASPQKVWVITDTRGSYSGGTPVEEEGYGKVPTIRTGADHEANLEVRGIYGNRNFSAIVNQTAKWNAFLVTNGELGLYIEDVSAYMKLIVDQGIKTTARWGINLKWSDDMSNPLVVDASALDSIFSN